jgi:hypothetical protein
MALAMPKTLPVVELPGSSTPSSVWAAPEADALAPASDPADATPAVAADDQLLPWIESMLNLHHNMPSRTVPQQPDKDEDVATATLRLIKDPAHLTQTPVYVLGVSYDRRTVLASYAISGRNTLKPVPATDDLVKRATESIKDDSTRVYHQETHQYSILCAPATGEPRPTASDPIQDAPAVKGSRGDCRVPGDRRQRFLL